ncbi:MAG: alpha/beta fold hydrolase [Pseudomonadales bacterium]
MPTAHLDELELEYQTYGAPQDTPLLLVHGLGVQLTNWSEAFIRALTDRGFFVIVYDNRDVGLSTTFDGWGPADIPAAFRQARARQPVAAPYTLEDMADDGIRLLDVIGVDRAHVLGLSNGGAIAQLMAIRHPERVASLVSMMATSGRRGLPRPTREADTWLAQPRNPEGTRDGAIRDALTAARLLGSPGYPGDEQAIRDAAGRDYDRAFNPQGNVRHLLASLASGDARAAKLADIRAPTLVIHGAEDPLVPVACGEDVRNSIPGAKMLVIPGMAHDLPEALVPQIADAIAGNARRDQEGADA